MYQVVLAGATSLPTSLSTYHLSVCLICLPACLSICITYLSVISLPLYLPICIIDLPT